MFKSILKVTGFVLVLQIVSSLIYLTIDWIILKASLNDYYYLLNPSTDLILLALLILYIRKKKIQFKELIIVNDISHYFSLTCLGFCLYVLRFPIYDFEYLLEIEPLPENLSFGELPAGYFIFHGLSKVLLIPIFEELIVKILILQALLNKGLSAKLSIAVSSVLFAYLHINLLEPGSSYLSFTSALIFGIISGAIFVRSKNVLYTIVLHASVNFLAFSASSLFVNEYVSWWTNENFGSVYWLLFLSGLIGFVFLYKHLIDGINAARRTF